MFTCGRPSDLENGPALRAGAPLLRALRRGRRLFSVSLARSRRKRVWVLGEVKRIEDLRQGKEAATQPSDEANTTPLLHFIRSAWY